MVRNNPKKYLGYGNFVLHFTLKASPVMMMETVMFMIMKINCMMLEMMMMVIMIVEAMVMECMPATISAGDPASLVTLHPSLPPSSLPYNTSNNNSSTNSTTSSSTTPPLPPSFILALQYS